MLNQGDPCPLCEAGKLQLRIPEHRITIGGVDVKDRTATALVCDACGEALITAAQRTRYELRAVALILRDGRKVSPSVLRAARRALGLKQSELAQLLETTDSTISRWENGKEPARRPVQMALAHLASDVERGVLDLEAALELARTSQPPEPPCLEVVKPGPEHDEAA
ncbi:MAG: type II TA system antitoxin MqsA family protein [Myxococcota bacterium]|nr:type II TA system antitoxin MqsA family protein [Myxococcota bacterium]